MPKRSAVRLALAALAAALLLAACGDEAAAPETPTGSPTATVQTLTMGSATELPADVALLLETGCFQCDGPATGLIRVTRSADGVSGRDLLLSAGGHLLYGETAGEPLYFAGDIPIPREIIITSKDQQQYEPYVTGIVAGPDGSEIVASVCVYPGCGVGMDAWSEKGRVALYRSVDGGNSWADFGTIDGGTVLGVVAPGKALAMSQASQDGPADVYLFPGEEPVERPRMAGGVFQPPMVLADGTIGWPDRSGALLRPDGSTVLNLPELPGVVGPYSIGSIVQQGFGDRLIAVYWFSSEERPYISILKPDGTHVRTMATNWIIGDGWAWASDSAVIANVEVTAEDLPATPPAGYVEVLPALIELSSGTIHPIVDPFLEEGAEAGRNFVRGVQRLGTE